MAKARLKRQGFHIDMTPLVDVGFLLLTFFMLTAKFKSDTGESVEIKLPSAQADTTKLPDVNIVTLTIGLSQVQAGETPDTLLYFGVSSEKDRPAVYTELKRVNPQTNQPYTNEELSKIPQMVVAKADLDILIKAARLQNPSFRYAINADRRLSYGYVDDIMRSMQKYGATRFNLVTTTQG